MNVGDTPFFAELAREVISMERHTELAERARSRLATLGYSNVTVFIGDGSAGFSTGAPYDAILVGAGAPRVPDALKSQLADGGRLVIPVGPQGHQSLTVVHRHGDQFAEALRESCVFVPLIGREGWPS